ncbi:MAG TPA: CHAT domain-containing protein [Nodosilinea sp.]|nr:CHAT domain-containing protein [Nodosilinea sp.]
MTQDFQLSITPVGGDTYWLRTEAVASGVPLAEAQVSWPLDTWLAQAEALFQDPLQALLSDPGPTEPRPDSPWTQLGQALYQGIFQGRIRDSWLAAQGVAQNRRQPLRLRLGFKDSRVQRLPWELLYGDDRPLATGLDVTLGRYYQGQAIADLTTMPPLAPATVPLRVLVVISAPDDQERLNLRQEVQGLMENLRVAPAAAGSLALDLTILEQPGRPELVQALEQGNFQILHYAGHSDVGETGGDLFLVNRQTGLSDWLSGEDLAGLLVNNGIRLAVFNSCRGAYTPQDDAQAGWRDQNLVQALVNRGVPGVIAMAERIPDDVALTFTQLLYRNLHQGHPIDLCLSRVRQGLMSAYGSGQPFWMLPLLYLRPDFDGYLYAREELAADLPGLGADEFSEVALLLPDYSTDPDISSLAAEILTHSTAAHPSDGVEPPLYDWLQEDAIAPHPTGDTTGDTTVDTTVARLVEQLSLPATLPPDRPLAADPAENLLPPVEPAQTTRSSPLPEPYPQAAPLHATPLSPAGRRWPLPGNLLVWGGLGVASLGAVLGLALTTLSTAPRDASEPLAATGNGAPQASPSSALVTSTLNALALGQTANARIFIEQLLDRNDLATAESVVAAIPQTQLLDPDIAYVRGRLQWQQMVSGRADAPSATDAMRSWTQATSGRPDFLEAWVALGFAHYTQADYSQAIRAWEQAIDLDRQQRRDIDPTATPQVANPITVNAYAGLAMAYQKESDITLLPAEQAPYRQQAQSFFTQALALDSTLIAPNALALNWHWSPDLIADWQDAVSRLAIDSAPVAPPADN